jgi:thioredoxin 1
MKSSSLPLLISVAMLAGISWMAFDMSRSKAAPGTVAAEIEGSTKEKPVMLEFYADWCAPCKEMEPVMKEFTKEVAVKVKLIRVNIDEDPKLGFAHGVGIMPAFIVFKDGRETARDSGMISKQRLLELLKQ